MKDKKQERTSEAHSDNQKDAQKAIAATPRYKYIGSQYDKGIQLPGGRMIRPLEMSDADIETLLATEPHAASLFELA
jgi:hypothetical protein